MDKNLQICLKTRLKTGFFLGLFLLTTTLPAWALLIPEGIDPDPNQRMDERLFPLTESSFLETFADELYVVSQLGRNDAVTTKRWLHFLFVYHHTDYDSLRRFAEQYEKNPESTRWLSEELKDQMKTLGEGPGKKQLQHPL